MRLLSLRPWATALLLLLALSRARGQESPAAAEAAAAAVGAPGRNDDFGAAAILSAMASRAQQNSLSQTLIALMALAAAEVEEPQGEGGGGNGGGGVSSNGSASASSLLLLEAAAAGAAPTSDNATTTTTTTTTTTNTITSNAEQDAVQFRNALRDHAEELVAQQQDQFVNALSFGQKQQEDASKDDGIDDGGGGFQNNIGGGARADKNQRRDALGALLAKVAERVVANGPASVQLRDRLVMGLGRAARTAATSQPGAGPCGSYGWGAGGEYAPAVWQGPILSLSLSLGSCALIPSLEGPGAALTAGSAWTNAVGELACLGPGLAYALSPLIYTSAGLSGESLSAPACRLSASFGPSLSLTLMRGPRQGAGGKGEGGGGKDVYPSEGAFLAAAALNGTLDRRIRRLERGLAVAAGLRTALPMWRKGEGVGEGQDKEEEEGDGGDYEFAWEKVEGKAGGDALRKGTGRHLAGELLRHVAWADKKGRFVNALAGGEEQASGAAAAVEASSSPSSPAFENRIG